MSLVRSPGTATPGGRGTLKPVERTAAVARVRRAIATAADRRGVLLPGEAILIACSGGPDSTALLDALARLAPPRGWRLSVAHVDHGLRQGSADEAALVGALASARGLAFSALAVEVEPGGSLQDRARTARHAALARRGSPGRGVGDRARPHRRRSGRDRADAGAGGSVAGRASGDGRAGARARAPAAPGLAGGDDRLLRRPRDRARRGPEQCRSSIPAQPGSVTS